MKKVLSLVLVVCMLIGMLPGVLVLAAGGESQITSPSNNEWLDTYNNDVVIRWTKPASGYTNKISILNTRTGEYLANNKEVSGTSYTLKKKTLEYWGNYKIWVGTFDGDQPQGGGSTIFINIIPLKDIKGTESKITSPSNEAWLNAWKDDIVIKWNKAADHLVNTITIYSVATKKYIEKDKVVNGTSYKIPKQKLGFEDKIEVTIKTLEAGNPVWNGHKIVFNTLPISEVEEEATITAPKDGNELDVSQDINVTFGNMKSSPKYRLTIMNQETGKDIIRNKLVSGGKYTISAGTLEPNSTYKIWLGTYLTSELDTAVGHGKSVVIKTKKSEVVQPPVPTNALEIKEFAWRTEETTAVGSYEVVGETFDYSIVEVRDSDGRVIFNQEYASAFKGIRIDMTDYTPGRYTATLHVYDENGEEACTDTAVFVYEKAEVQEQPKTTLEVQAFGWHMSDTMVVGSYEVTGDGFDCAIVEIMAPDGNVIYSKEYAAPTKTMKFDMADYPGGKYTTKMHVYDENGEVACKVSSDFTYEKEEVVVKEPLKITSCYFTKEMDTLVLVYSVSGDDFDYAEVCIEDEDGNAVANKNIYKAKGELSVALSKLAGGEYTGTVAVYNTAGEKADSDSTSFEYEKKIESKFSVKNIVAPSGTLTYGEAFTASGRVVSACEITDAKILIYKQGRAELIDSVHKKKLGKTEFDIGEYASQIDFSIFDAGDYTYVVEVTDTNGNQYTAVESDFSVEEEKQTQNSLFKDVSKSHVNYEAIAALVEKGVISGYEDGTFRPNQSITRAEFAKMLCVTFDFGTSSGASFDDTKDHWGKAFIERAKNLGIVNGKGDNKFAPDDNVTYEEAAKMLVCTKRWDFEAIDNGGWPDGYIKIAEGQGFFNGTSVLSNGIYKTMATRADIAQMMYNALKAECGVLWTTKLMSPLKTGLKVTGISSTTHNYKCDFVAAKGTPIYAPTDGEVKFCQTYDTALYKGKLVSYGNNVVFTSEDGSVYIKMAHFDAFIDVELKIPSSETQQASDNDKGVEGRTDPIATRKVRQGELIGYSGATGNASAPHLHMEVKKNGTWVNPATAFDSWN